jgi:ankyrin repeat protein
MMKYNYTPVKSSALKAVISAALFFLLSINTYAAGNSGRIQLASLSSNAQQPAPARPNPEELFAASLRGDIRTVQRLVKERINVNHSNSDSETALHMAASRGHLSVVIFLLNNGANINSRTRNNWIPLHHAVRFNRPQVANYLMAKGAPPHFKTGDGLDSFDIAVNMSNMRMINMVQGYMNRR